MRKWRYIVIVIIIILSLSLSLTHTHTTHTHTHTHTETAPDDVSDVFQISNFKDYFEHSHFTLIDSLSFVSAPPSHDFSDTSLHCSLQSLLNFSSLFTPLAFVTPVIFFLFSTFSDSP